MYSDGVMLCLYYTPLLDLDCVSVLSNNAGLKTATWLPYCLRLRSRSPHNAQHSTSIYNIIRPARPYVHRYCACAALRANVARRIGNRVSPAESAFSARDRVRPAESWTTN